MADQVVTIEGSITPSAELARGERRTVLLTDRIKRLAAKGYIVIVGDPQDVTNSTSPAPADHTGVTANDPSGNSPLPTGDFAPAATAASSSVADLSGDVPQHPDETAQPEKTGRQAGPAATDEIETAEKPTG